MEILCFYDVFVFLAILNACDIICLVYVQCANLKQNLQGSLLISFHF